MNGRITFFICLSSQSHSGDQRQLKGHQSHLFDVHTLVPTLGTKSFSRKWSTAFSSINSSGTLRSHCGNFNLMFLRLNWRKELIGRWLGHLRPCCMHNSPDRWLELADVRSCHVHLRQDGQSYPFRIRRSARSVLRIYISLSNQGRNLVLLGWSASLKDYVIGPVPGISVDA